jgi:hypothetical protein
MRRITGIGLAASIVAVCAVSTAAGRVLRVGSYRGAPGSFRDVQAAVDAAKPGDWILIGPGDYHEAATRMPAGAHGDDRAGAGVLIQTPRLWIRGMDRNSVWIDGTRIGAPRCSNADTDQLFGPVDAKQEPGGRNGILIYKAPDVIVENLSVCNFLIGDLGGGNQIWWDGGASTGTQTSLGVWWGSYLTATSSYFKDASTPSAGYGIYSSNTKAPGYGKFAHDYASNMNDSAYYVGACPDCNVTLDDVHGENAPQGYSGTNSGGHVVVENSEFDRNMTGFATGDLNDDDQPSPQDGTCPGNAVNPDSARGIQRTHICWIFINNYVHDNNNANVPVSGIAGLAIPGTGITIYGGRHDVFTNNRITDNGAWGILFTQFPDNEQPPDIAHCGGGTDLSTPGSPLCYFDDWGSEFANNTFTHNGYFGNPSNGDIAEISQTGPNYNPDSNCFHGNRDTGRGLTSDPANIDSYSQCGHTYPPANDPLLIEQSLCASSALGTCPPGVSGSYPKPTKVVLSLPPAQATMPDPCAGVTIPNAWCGGQVTRVPGCAARFAAFTLPALAPGERFGSVSVNGRLRRARGRRVRVDLGGRHHRTSRLRMLERIRVGRARESIRFSRIYRRC